MKPDEAIKAILPAGTMGKLGHWGHFQLTMISQLAQDVPNSHWLIKKEKFVLPLITIGS